MGLKLYRLVPETSSRTAAASSLQVGTKPRPYLENEFFRVEINPETGYIARLYDKQNKREAFRGEGNFLVALEDTAEQAKATSPEYAGPAWDIGLTGKKWDIGKAARVEVIEQGPAACHTSGSPSVQRLRIYSGYQPDCRCAARGCGNLHGLARALVPS